MYKHLLLLGLLLERPMYGQQIREVIETHHALFADAIKKPTIYYQLERLAHEGYLEIRHEAVEAPGPGAAHEDFALRERDVYYITPAGRSYFSTLLRSMLSEYAPRLSSIDACLFFLQHLTPTEAVSLLEARYQQVAHYKKGILEQMEKHPLHNETHMLVNDHKLTLLNAELSWLEGAIAHLNTRAEASR